MVRVFVCLAVGWMVVCAATGVLGIARLEEPPQRHIVLGIFALLLSCFIQVVVFTYFTVTGKMLAQALHLGHFDLQPLLEAKRLKRSTTRLLACATVSVLGVTVTGALHWRSRDVAAAHWLTAATVLIVHGWVFFVQHRLIAENSRLFDEVMREYGEAKGKGQQDPSRNRQGADDREQAQRV